MSARRTFWHLEGKRRVPTDYEIKSSRLLYYPERGLAVKTPVGAWIERYQAGSPLDLRLARAVSGSAPDDVFHVRRART